MPEETIVSDPEELLNSDGEQNSDELDPEEGGEKPSTEGKKYLGRFDSEEEAQEYVKELEDKAKDAGLKEISGIRDNEEVEPEEEDEPKPKKKATKKGIRDVLDEESASVIEDFVNSKVDPIHKAQREKQDLVDSQIVLTMPNYKKYIPSAREFMKRNPKASILEAYKAVADPEDIARLNKKQQSPQEREILKRGARGERSGDAGDTSDPNAAKALEKQLFGADAEHKTERNFFGVV